MTDVFVHESACVDEPCTIGAGSKIWHFCHISRGAHLGAGCVLGQNVFVGESVRIGARVRIQNNVSIYAGTEVEDDVFLGPSCVLTNVSNPRAELSRRHAFEPTIIRRGATVGANATIVCGVTLGRHSFVAAGAVVTQNVPDYGFVVGVPARHEGYMSRHGQRLHLGGGRATCPESGFVYELDREGALRCVDLDEDAPLTSTNSSVRPRS